MNKVNFDSGSIEQSTGLIGDARIKNIKPVSMNVAIGTVEGEKMALMSFGVKCSNGCEKCETKEGCDQISFCIPADMAQHILSGYVDMIKNYDLIVEGGMH